MADICKTREAELSKKEICRFCLAQRVKLASIYKENVKIKSTATLPLQIMAITSIEVNLEDGMPIYICFNCRLLFEHSYRFKQMCKQADTLLRQYPLTGQWPDELDKPRPPHITLQVTKNKLSETPPIKLLNTMAKSNSVQIDSVEIMQTSNASKKLLNSTNESNKPMRFLNTSNNRSKFQAYQEKVENNQELSMDDVHHMIADIADELNKNTDASSYAAPSTSKPKLLNKSTMRILNKGANSLQEPRLATPQIKRDESGNVALVTEILDPNNITETTEDPVLNAAPVATNVYPCPQCERSFPLLQLRDIHMVNHTRERSFQCSECDKSFFSKYDLQKHNFVHTGERPFKCSVCDKAFTRSALLHRHERTHTDIPKFICVYCEKPFISRAEMEKHAERHTKRRPFQCGVCGKSFAFKQGLERHEVIHCNDLPFPCQYCNLSFITAGKLARHLVAHAGKRAYPCKYCSKSYLLSHHLSRHLRSHKQGAATFMCSICKDTHQTYDSLVDHSSIHASISLTCPLCKECLDDVDSVERHIQAHKESETFACEFCDLIFLNQSTLQKHIEDDHVMDMVPYQGNDEEPSTATGEASDLGVKVESDLLQELLDDEEDDTASVQPSRAKIRKVNEEKNTFQANTKKIKETSLSKPSTSDANKRQTRSHAEKSSKQDSFSAKVQKVVSSKK